MNLIQHLQPTLQDDLVLIRPLQKSDFDALYAVASDPLVWEQHPNNDRYKKEVFEALFAEAMQTNAAFLFLDKTNQEVIGSSRYKWYPESEELEIGWTFFARHCWGGRYNFAVKRLMLNYAFGLVDAVIFHVGITNFRSQKAVLKLGATQIETIVTNGRESVKFVLSKENWNDKYLSI
jgi:RimJ/RimL family protein N-acetyltransferase